MAQATFNFANKLNGMGKFMMLPKEKLIIAEDTYQRKMTSQKRVDKIANNWDWHLVGAIIVSERNGKYYVVDGGHRVRASMKLNGMVKELPCMVYKKDGVQDESKTFMGQEDRKNLSCYDRHRAALCAKDPVAIQVDKIANESGYRISDSAGDFVFQAIASLYKAVKSNAQIASQALSVCADIAGGERIFQCVFEGLFHLEVKYSEQHRKSMLTDHNIDKLKKAGMISMLREINGLRAQCGTNSVNCKKISASAILNILNKGVRNKIKVSL